MIIKEADDHQRDVDACEALLATPNLNAEVAKRISIEIKRIKAGMRGEQNAAYEINRHYGDSPNHAVLHDLRIVVGDQVAQIDHLVMNRTLLVSLCETKNFAEGLGCNAHGEWVGFRAGKTFGIASPLYQGKRHVDVLGKLLAEKHPWHPKKLGERLKIVAEPFVLVSNTARIARPPEGSVPDMHRVVKIEAFADKRQAHNEKRGVVDMLWRIISAADLMTFARGLASCHVPATVDWAGKFGLDAVPTSVETVKDKVEDVLAQPARKRCVCDGCGAAVTFAVASFCWRNTKRFGGSCYCRACQPENVVS